MKKILQSSKIQSIPEKYRKFIETLKIQPDGILCCAPFYVSQLRVVVLQGGEQYMYFDRLRVSVLYGC